MIGGSKVHSKDLTQFCYWSQSSHFCYGHFLTRKGARSVQIEYIDRQHCLNYLEARPLGHAGDYMYDVGLERELLPLLLMLQVLLAAVLKESEQQLQLLTFCIRLDRFSCKQRRK